MAKNQERRGYRRPNIWRSPLVLASMALAVIGCALYIATVPALASAHEAAVPRVNARGRGSLSRTAGSVWGIVVARSLFGGSSSADGVQVATDGTVTLADGERVETAGAIGFITLAGSSGQGLIAAVTSNATAKTNVAGGGTSAAGASQGSHAASSGSNSSSGGTAGATGGNADTSTGGTSSGGSTGGASSGPSEAQEAELHSWLVTKASALDGYVSRVNAAVSTYRSTGDTSACDALDGEILNIRAQFGRKYVPNDSRWAGQFEALWGCYTNLDIIAGSYGTDPDAPTNYNAFRGRLAL